MTEANPDLQSQSVSIYDWDQKNLIKSSLKLDLKVRIQMFGQLNLCCKCVSNFDIFVTYIQTQELFLEILYWQVL